MNTMTYWDVLKNATKFGFIFGWLSGTFLALWAYFTLGL